MKFITTSVQIGLPKERVWELFTAPKNIEQWNFASPEWHCPSASNKLKVNGKFSYRMEARNGSFGFDFSGKFDEIIPSELIRYTIDDGRKVEISFVEYDGITFLSKFLSQKIKIRWKCNNKVDKQF